MAGSETPVNPSNESSQHLKEDETPQSPVSEEWKKKKPKKEEPKKVPQLVFVDFKSSGVQDFLFDRARFPVLDEDLIGERGQALDRDYGGGTRLTINHLKSNVTQSNIIQVPNNDTPAFSKVHPNQMSNIGRVPNYDTPASSTDHPNQMVRLKKTNYDKVPQFGVWEDESEAGHNRWIGNVWKSIKNLVVKPVFVFKSLMYLFHCQVSWMKVKLVATYEDLIAERGRPLPRNHGRCKKLASKQPAEEIQPHRSNQQTSPKQ